MILNEPFIRELIEDEDIIFNKFSAPFRVKNHAKTDRQLKKEVEE